MEIKFERDRNYKHTTPCPFKRSEIGFVTQVGSFACRKECEYYGGSPRNPKKIITCNHPEAKEKIEK